jgi:uncharacterized protein
MRLVPALLLLALTPPLAAQPNPYKERTEYVRSHYAKYEYQIPMRDEKRLFTSVYVPNNVHFGKRYPILLMRTPYSVSPYGLDRYKDTLAPTATYEKDGYIFAFQDVRGRWMSEGEFVNMRPRADIDESTDTYDTVDWLTKNLQGNNGKVGLWGISYPGFYAAYGAINSHPALKATSPQAPIADWWRGDDMHRNGAFNLLMSFGFFSSFGQPRPEPTAEPARPYDYGTVDPYQFYLELGPLRNAAKKFGFPNAFWEQITQHPNYDEFWQSRNLLPHLKGIRAATMVVGGWFDTEDLYGPLNIYQQIRKNNPGTPTHLVMGPWDHGGWWRTDGKTLGDADFGFATSTTYLEAEQAFFEHHLKTPGNTTLPGALVYETGANRWRSFPSWPPGAKPTTFYLGDQESLRGKAGSAYEQFVSDPRKPVPYTQDNSSIRQSKAYMAEDQRFAARRPDVLVFQTEPLQQDTTVAGPIEVDLLVSTSQQDADWVVKLVDVNPGRLPGSTAVNPIPYKGHQQTLVRGEPMRGRFRDSWSEPKPFEPNQPAHVRFRLNDVCHTFQRNHRIMVQVQSTWFPYIDRNPQKWVSNIFEARPEDFTPATHRVYHQSKITLPVLP